MGSLSELWKTAERINDHLDRGYLALNENGELVDPLARFTVDGGRLVLVSPEGVEITYYDSECEWMDPEEVLGRLRKWRFARASAFKALEDVP